MNATSLHSRRGIAILLLLSLVQFMDVLDGSILNIALSSIEGDLGFTQQSRRALRPRARRRHAVAGGAVDFDEHLPVDP
jgi:hypothetical protein